MSLGIDEKKQELETIVPEYNSKNPIIKWLFLKRIWYAISQVRDLPKNAAVLDAWCGDGRLLQDLSALDFKDLYGIDFNENVLQLNIQNAQIICGDLHGTWYKDEQFDAIIILDTLEHIEDVSNVIKELFRILKKDGIVITSLPTENIFYKIGRLLLKGTTSMQEGPWTGIHYHTADQLHTYIQKEFTCVKKHYLPWFPPFNLFNMFTYKK